MSDKDRLKETEGLAMDLYNALTSWLEGTGTPEETERVQAAWVEFYEGEK